MSPGSRLNSISDKFYLVERTSYYNMGLCEACMKPILKGELITQCSEPVGMKLRYRSHKDGSFYTPYTGARFVHRECQIIEDGIAIWTDWAAENASKLYDDMSMEDLLKDGWVETDSHSKDEELEKTAELESKKDRSIKVSDILYRIFYLLLLILIYIS